MTYFVFVLLFAHLFRFYQVRVLLRWIGRGLPLHTQPSSDATELHLDCTGGNLLLEMRRAQGKILQRVPWLDLFFCNAAPDFAPFLVRVV